jgi:hypothetical protein
MLTRRLMISEAPTRLAISTVVSTVVPEVLEEVRQDLVLDVLGLHAVGGAALLHHLEKN